MKLLIISFLAIMLLLTGCDCKNRSVVFPDTYKAMYFIDNYAKNHTLEECTNYCTNIGFI